ncbi:LEA type 2 family protein [Aridibaculum aurantiacum]|uniref:LEA type 2 family protein n=1 Tax=Aridibaculum aurantiacum TaxID=2810307 RepID=UPI001A974C9A|nr:LEA type 2 family protein [Aridibaculum aurantiacum]
MRLLLPLLLLTFLSFTACKKPQGFDYRDIKNFRVSNWGFNKLTVAMDLLYFNPNNFGVTLKKVDCDIYLDNTYVGKFLLDTTMVIPRNAEFTLPASMDVDMKNIFKNSLNVLFSNEVLVAAKGTTRVGKSGVFINVPFNYEGRHKVDLFNP